MSRLTDLEAEVEALRMVVADLVDAVGNKEPKENDADREAKRDKADREENKQDQKEGERSALEEFKKEPSAFEKFENEPSARDRFEKGVSAIEEFKKETIERRKEFQEFVEGDIRLEEAIQEEPEALKEDVVIGPTHPNIINQIVREPVKFDLGTPKKEELRTNAQPGFITLKAEDPDGDYYTYEVLGLKTGNALTDPSVYTLPVATSTVLGGIKLGYSGAATDYDVKLNIENRAYVTVPIATSEYLGTVKIGFTESGKNYPVELLNEQMFVNVPWTDTTYTLPVASDSVLGGLKTGFSPQSDDNKYALDLDDSSNKAFITLGSATANKIGGIKIGHGTSHPKYEVLLDASAGKAYVNVPWTDTNTTYSVGDGGLTQKNFTTALNTKLTGIEDNATADQTAAEIRYLVENATDSNVYTDTHKNYVQSLIDGGSP